MPYSKQLILALGFLTFFQYSVHGQSIEKNLDKYWNYRDRLSTYFVKIGPEIGESVVAYVRNRSKSHTKGFDVGDQTIDLAWYIGILATEYQLLNEQKQSTESTLQELYYALMAFERLDRCEKYPPWNLDKDTLDGFFHRYDVELETHPEIFSIEGRNKNLNPEDTWGTKELGIPTYIGGYANNSGTYNYYSASSSQDQVVHLLMGFSLVYKCLPKQQLRFTDLQGQSIQFNFNLNAQENIDRIIQYFHKDKGWIIKDPHGDNVERGHNALMYAYPIAALGQRITGKSYDNAWSQSFLAKKLWGLSRVPNWVNDFNSTMALTLAALSDTWWDVTPFTKINNTGYYIDKCGKVWHRETFFLSLYQFINDKKTNSYDLDKILGQLDSAPFNGTYYWSQDSVKFDCCGMQAGKPEGGWAFPNKFRGTKKEQEGQGKYPTTGNFSGIDYMLLYNLYHLNEHPIPYKRKD